MAENNGHDLLTPFERLEGMVEVILQGHIDFQRDHKNLLTAQILMIDKMDQLTTHMDQLTARMDQVAAAQLHTDDRLNALIAVVDDMVRGRSQ